MEFYASLICFTSTCSSSTEAHHWEDGWNEGVSTGLPFAFKKPVLSPARLLLTTGPWSNLFCSTDDWGHLGRADRLTLSSVRTRHFDPNVIILLCISQGISSKGNH